jgi:hypothetical protein
MASSTPQGQVREYVRACTRELLDEFLAIEELMRAFPSPHYDPDCPVLVETDTYSFGLMLRCVVRQSPTCGIEGPWVSARAFVSRGGLGALLRSLYESMDRRRHSVEFCVALVDYTRDRTVTERVLPFSRLTMLEMHNLKKARETAWREMVRATMVASRWPRLCAAVAGLDPRLSLHVASGVKCAVTVRRDRLQTPAMLFGEIGTSEQWCQHVASLAGIREYTVTDDPAIKSATCCSERWVYTPVGTFILASTAQRTRRTRGPRLPSELVHYVVTEFTDLRGLVDHNDDDYE